MLHTIISQRASQTPKKVAVIQGQRRITYGELELKASRLATFLVNTGLQKGDRIAILSENSPEYIIAYIGIHKAGGIAVDINYQNTAREVQKIINHCLPVALIAERRYLDGIESCVAESPSVRIVIGIDRRSKRPASPPERMSTASGHLQYRAFDDVAQSDAGCGVLPVMGPHDTAAIIYTSGTTGDPKGVMLSHDNLLSNASSIISYLHLTEHDKVMVMLPFCYSYGKSLLTTHLQVGGTMVLENSFMYPDVVLKKIIEEEVTGFAGVPSTFAILLNRSAIRNYGFPKLRYVTQAGGPMPPQHAQELIQILPDTSVYIMYGQTEAAPRLTYLDPRDVIRKAGSIGKAIPGVTIDLIKEGGIPAIKGEEGEIVASGRNIMIGYWNNPEQTRKVLRDGKLFTGDIAKMDDEGFLYIVGRQNDMIKSGAHRISAKEIEEVILGLQAVHEVAVIGVEDHILGEAIKAFIVLKEGAKLDAQEIQRYCAARLASFKVPKEVAFVSDLPKTNSGKVRRHMLKRPETYTHLQTSREDALKI